MTITDLAVQPKGRPAAAAIRYRSVLKAIDYLHEHLDEPLTLQVLAEVAALSPYHFSRVFRQITGLQPMRFLCALRLNEAKKLLLTTDLKVIDVCYAVGYNSLGSFGTRFAEMVGLTPSDLRCLAAKLQGIQLQERFAGCRSFQNVVPMSPGVRGRISGPEPFEGMTFVGLFRSPLPHRLPVACSVRQGFGAYHVPHVPDGRYYVVAAAVPWCNEPTAFFLHGNSLRGQSGPVWVQDNRTSGLVDLSLRRALPTDPPIIPALPLILAAQLEQADAGAQN